MQQLKLDFLNGIDWKTFATVRKWKHGIEMNSKKGDFPKKTWERSCTLICLSCVNYDVLESIGMSYMVLEN